MNNKDRFMTIVKIVERAESLDICIGDRMTCIMDMEFADKQFNLRLEEMLATDDENFAHDFCGIQRHMNRETCKVEDFFLPRFAG